MSIKAHPSLSLLAMLLLCCAAQAESFHYMRLGNSRDVETRPSAGTAMMGGGRDLDEAFRWLCGKAEGGDFLILRATGDDSYNAYVNGLCRANSVATLIIPNRDAASDPAVADIIGRAEALFIAGGDQANYIRFWRKTGVEEAINKHIASGKPIGGTSAGLAVEGEFVYGALNDPDDSELHSKDALANPFQNQVTIVRDFLKIPRLRDTITDSHFAKRDRMGRTLVFLARIMQDGWSEDPRDIAIDEKSAVLLEPDGKGTVVGTGQGAYFLRPTKPPKLCRSGAPLQFPEVAVSHVRAGGHFDLVLWKGDGDTGYSLSVENGLIRSTLPGNAVY
jgi:cyanophycinase